MNPESRQTLLGVFGLTAVMLVALNEGFNGHVTVSYFAAVIALITPQALDKLPMLGGRAG